MKKLLLLLIVAIYCHTLNAQEKSFQKGKITIGIGAGFGLFGTKSHQEQDESVYYNGSIHTNRVVKDTIGGSASGTFPLTVEYGITNWLGIGGRFGYSNYISNADSTNKHIKPTVTGLDCDLMVNFHFIKTKHFDMPIQLTLGYSKLKYMANDANGSAAKGSGLNYGFALVPHIYFGNYVGIFFNLGYSGMSYPNMIFSNNTNSNLNSGSGNYVYKIKGNGVNAGLGVAVKFH